MSVTADSDEHVSGATAGLRGGEPALLTVEHLTVEFDIGRGSKFRAVDDVSFDVRAGETLGIVGESGSGKSTTAKSIVQLPPPTSGEIRYGPKVLRSLSKDDLRALRTDIQMIFQDPVSALNPRRSVREIIREGVDIWGTSDRWTTERLTELVQSVGIDPASLDRKPFEFSGGQCQRIGIARALAVEPNVLICDEPTSALDVSVQAQILNLLHDLKAEHDLTMLFISHDLAVVRNVSDRVMVMNRGQVVELGAADNIFEDPAHEYTRTLLSAVPGSAVDESSVVSSGDDITDLSRQHLEKVGDDHWVARS